MFRIYSLFLSLSYQISFSFSYNSYILSLSFLLLSPLLSLVSYKYFRLSRCFHFSFIRFIFFSSTASSSSFRHISLFAFSYFLLFYLLQYFSSHFCIVFFLPLPPRLLFLAYYLSILSILSFYLCLFSLFLSFILSLYLSRHQFLIFFSPSRSLFVSVHRNDSTSQFDSFVLGFQVLLKFFYSCTRITRS